MMENVPTKKYPMLNKLGRVTTPFGGKTRYEGSHKGIDIANKIGTPIPAFVPGKVIAIKPGQKPGENNYGNSILIKDKFGNIHRYSHLTKILVKPGEEVKKDEKIGTMGETGSAYSESSTAPGAGSHLDYRIHNAYKQFIDPTKYVKKYV